MNTLASYLITGTGRISAVVGGKSYTVDKDHTNYTAILDAVKAKAWDTFVSLTDVAKGLTEYITGDVQISDGAIIYNGEVLHNTLTSRILTFMREGLPFEPMTKFLANLVQNPSFRAINELYDFLEAGELPITEDGHFLAFKNVRADFKDIHSGEFDNSVGQKLSMTRNMVDEDKNRTCSSGLHFCSIKYLPHFSDSNGGHTMIVKINPKDVVAIPADYANAKGRTCAYEVVAEYMEDWRNRAEDASGSGFDEPLYSSEGGDYEDDDKIGYERGKTDAENGTYDNPYCNYEDREYDDLFDGYESGYNDTIANIEKEFEDEEIYGTKPSGHKFYNKRNGKGQFA